MAREFKTQQGIRNYDWDRSNGNNFFNGRFQLNKANLDAYDPFITGYAFIIWMELPAFFDQTRQQNFKNMTQKNFKSFSGIGDMTLNFDQISAGFTGNEYPVPTTIAKENTSFSLKHTEFAGSPIRDLYTYWVTGIRDFETGIAHYHGKVNSEGLKYSMKNQVGELLYIVTDPSAGVNNAADAIEFAAYYTNVIPTKIPQDHLNYNSGDHGVVEVDIEFRGNFHMSEKINQLAASQLKTLQLLEGWGSFDPQKSFGDGTSTTTVDGSGK